MVHWRILRVDGYYEFLSQKMWSAILTELPDFIAGMGECLSVR